jgi:hypothetical protein
LGGCYGESKQKEKITMAQYLFAVMLLVCSASSTYAQSLQANRIKNPRVGYTAAANLRKYPIPALAFEGEGKPNENVRKEIVEKIVYPVINVSKRPIAAIIVEFYFNKAAIGVSLIYHGADPTGAVNYATALIDRNKAGHFDDNAYKVFFDDEGY